MTPHPSPRLLRRLYSALTITLLCAALPAAASVTGAACPADGDPAYSLVPAAGNNNEHAVEFARLGNLAVNPYGAGESGSFYVDEFASFRTLAP